MFTKTAMYNISIINTKKKKKNDQISNRHNWTPYPSTKMLPEKNPQEFPQFKLKPRSIGLQPRNTTSKKKKKIRHPSVFASQLGERHWRSSLGLVPAELTLSTGTTGRVNRKRRGKGGQEVIKRAHNRRPTKDKKGRGGPPRDIKNKDNRRDRAARSHKMLSRYECGRRQPPDPLCVYSSIYPPLYTYPPTYLPTYPHPLHTYVHVCSCGTCPVLSCPVLSAATKQR